MSKKTLTILAIETSADETSAAIFKHEKIQSNIIFSQIAKHALTGGIVPEVAARAHIPKILPAIKTVLKQTNTKLAEISAIAVTNGPGLITSLRIGVDTAKSLAFIINKPIIPINHLEGHLLSGLAGKTAQFSRSTPRRQHRNKRAAYDFQKIFPSIGLIVSGGHTMLVLVKKIGQYKILGETVDDAAGEAFDKIAKILGLSYPGGPAIALRSAKFKKQNQKNEIELPRPLINSPDFRFSFSGLKTAAWYKFKELSKQKKINYVTTNQFAHETENAIIEVLVAKTIHAAKLYQVKSILVGGGVAANLKLQKSLKTTINKQLPNVKFFFPNSDLTTDNAGMIVFSAYWHLRHNHYTNFEKIQIDPNLRLASWR